MGGNHQGRLPALAGEALHLESGAFLEFRCWLPLTNEPHLEASWRGALKADPLIAPGRPYTKGTKINPRGAVTANYPMDQYIIRSQTYLPKRSGLIELKVTQRTSRHLNVVSLGPASDPVFPG